MPLKVEEQNLLSETLTLTTPQADNNNKESNEVKMSSTSNSTTETPISNSNNKPTTNGTNHSMSLNAKENNISGLQHANPQQLNESDPTSDSPPAKRIKTASPTETINDQEMIVSASTSSSIAVKEEEESYSAMPVEEESPQYKELRQVGRSTPTLTESCFAVPTHPPTLSSIEETCSKRTTLNVGHVDYDRNITELQHVNSTLPAKKNQQQSIEVSSSEPVLMDIAETYTKESQSILDNNVEMEDYSSVVRLITDQIVTQVSNAQDTSFF